MKYKSSSLFKCTIKNLSSIILCNFFIIYAYSQQESDPNENIKIINKKLKVISSPSPEIVGGYIRNDSYEGVKGRPYLFNEFQPLIFKTKEIDYYVSIEANIDLKTNSILYKNKEDNQLYSIPVNRVEEVIVKNENDTFVLKTSEGKYFEPKLDELRFYQILKEGPNEFIKIPYKIFIPADYTGAYTAKRRYDEYKTEYDYYLMSSDKIYKKVFLTKRSLIKAFPENRELIKHHFKMMSNSNKEAIVSIILDKIN